MIALLLAGAGFGYYTLCTLFIIICILLIFMVVITPSSEGGMAAAFGGMGSDSFFGTKAHQSINKFTVFLAVSFLVLAFWINWTNKTSTTSEGAVPTQSEREQKMKNLPQTPKSEGTLPPPPPPK
jgi:preprotein translocase subunit SecG